MSLDMIPCPTRLCLYISSAAPLPHSIHNINLTLSQFPGVKVHDGTKMVFTDSIYFLTRIDSILYVFPRAKCFKALSYSHPELMNINLRGVDIGTSTSVMSCELLLNYSNDLFLHLVKRPSFS